MKRIVTISALILVISTVALAVLYYLAGFSLKKSLLVSYGAGVAMILFDLVVPYVRHRRSIRRFNHKNQKASS